MERVAVVTGSNKGIGKEIALKLAQANYKTILACRSESLGRQVEEEFRALGLDVEYRQCDLASSESIASFAQSLSADYASIDVLVNNGAIAFKGSDPTPFRHQARPTIDVNFFGTLRLTQLLLPLLRNCEHPPARIVNVASMMGHLRLLKDQGRIADFTAPDLSISRLECLMKEFVSDVESGTHENKGWPNSCYGMSKLGVIALTKALAREEGRGRVLVNACCPGYCATDMSSHKGPRSAEHGARTLALLAMAPQITNTGGFYQDENEVQW